MKTDEYGYGPRGKKQDIKINLTRYRKWWHRIWGPKKSEIEAELQQAKRDRAQFEAWFSRPTGGPKL